MASPSVTYSFTNGTTADGAQVNTNFTDLINGLTDGTKDLVINSLTTNGNVILGSSVADTVTLNGVLSGTLLGAGSLDASWMNNVSIVRATTTNAGDSIKITSSSGAALSATNPGKITLSGTTAGQLSQFSITADITILLTGAHWGLDTLGDLEGALLRVLAINDNGTLKFGVAYLGGRTTLLTTDTNTTHANVNIPEEVLCNSAVASATNRCKEIGYVRANFDDTGGAAENLWAIQAGIDDVVTGQSADGYWQTWIPEQQGFSSVPANPIATWCQVGRKIHVILINTASGTSNSINFSITLPAKSRYAFNAQWSRATDNSSVLTTHGRVLGIVDNATISVFSNAASATWTSSGSKSADLNFAYEVGPVASFI